MPNIFEIFKNYVIESEDDVPEQFREEIERRLDSVEPLEEPEIVCGRRGKVISKENEIEDIFNNRQEFYFGHGTSGRDEVISSIFETGLKTVNPEIIKIYGNTLRGLDSTTIAFGEGTDSLFKEQKDLLEHWPHKDSKNIVIVSIPRKYALQKIDVGLSDLYEAFYIGSKENGFSLRPEFIKGVYNADSHDFMLNDNFYQNLDEEQQRKILEEVSKKYIKSFSEHSGVSPIDTATLLSLNETELEELTIEWYKVQLKRFREDKTFDSQQLGYDLHDMSENITKSDFEDATHSIRYDALQNEEEKENIDEGWLVDDDWE